MNQNQISPDQVPTDSPPKTSRFSTRTKSLWLKFTGSLKKVFVSRKQDVHTFRTRLVIGIVFGIILIIIVFIVVFGIGLYKYHWKSKTAVWAENIIPYPAAFVGSDVILLRDYNERLWGLEHYFQKMKQKPQKGYQKSVLDEMVEEKLYQREARKIGITVTDKEVEEQYQNIILGQGGEAQVKKLLTELWGWDVAYFKTLIRAKLYKPKLEQEIPIAVHVRHIFYKFPDKANSKAKYAVLIKAEKMFKQIEAGKNFAEMAKKYSEDTATKDKGGDLGWVTRSQIETKISKDCAQKIMAMTVNETEICKSNKGDNVVNILEKRGRVDKSFTEWFKDVQNKTKVFRFVGK